MNTGACGQFAVVAHKQTASISSSLVVLIAGAFMYINIAISVEALILVAILLRLLGHW